MACSASGNETFLLPSSAVKFRLLGSEVSFCRLGGWGADTANEATRNRTSATPPELGVAAENATVTLVVAFGRKGKRKCCVCVYACVEQTSGVLLCCGPLSLPCLVHLCSFLERLGLPTQQP